MGLFFAGKDTPARYGEGGFCALEICKCGLWGKGKLGSFIELGCKECNSWRKFENR